MEFSGEELVRLDPSAGRSEDGVLWMIACGMGWYGVLMGSRLIHCMSPRGQAHEIYDI